MNNNRVAINSESFKDIDVIKNNNPHTLLQASSFKLLGRKVANWTPIIGGALGVGTFVGGAIAVAVCVVLSSQNIPFDPGPILTAGFIGIGVGCFSLRFLNWGLERKALNEKVIEQLSKSNDLDEVRMKNFMKDFQNCSYNKEDLSPKELYNYQQIEQQIEAKLKLSTKTTVKTIS